MFFKKPRGMRGFFICQRTETLRNSVAPRARNIYDCSSGFIGQSHNPQTIETLQDLTEVLSALRKNVEHQLDEWESPREPGISIKKHPRSPCSARLAPRGEWRDGFPAVIIGE